MRTLESIIHGVIGWLFSRRRRGRCKIASERMPNRESSHVALCRIGRLVERDECLRCRWGGSGCLAWNLLFDAEGDVGDGGQAGAGSHAGCFGKRDAFNVALARLEGAGGSCGVRRRASGEGGAVGAGKARVALARKLAVILFAMWRGNQPFRWAASPAGEAPAALPAAA